MARRILCAALTLVALALPGSRGLQTAGRPDGAGGLPPSPEASADRRSFSGGGQTAGLLYVCVQDDAKVAVVDMAARAVVRTIDLTQLGFPATAKPHYIVVEPDRSYWYVSLIGANRVVKFDAQDRVAGHFEMETPGMLALAGAHQLLVSRSMSAVNPPKRVAILDRRTMAGDEVDVLFLRPHPMAVARRFAYTGSLGENRIASIGLEDQRVQIIDVAGPTHSLVQFAVSQDERMLVATAEISGRLLVFDLAEPSRPTLTRTISVGKMAFDPTFTPDGRFVYVPVKSSSEIVVLETKGWTEARRIKDAALQQPHQVVFSPDGSTAFVTNNNKMDHMADPAHAGHPMPGAAGGGVASLVIIDVASGKVAKAIELGKNLTGMGTAR
jgi:DNA-binding beta-propeller fold protein YncE